MALHKDSVDFAVAMAVGLSQYRMAFPVALAVAANAVGFMVSASLQSDLAYDLIGAASHVAVAVAGISLCPHVDSRTWLVGIAIILWAARIGAFLFLRSLHAGGDSRFDKIKRSPQRFAIAWTLQTLWVLINCSPLLALLAAPAPTPATALGLWEYLTLAAWFAGFAIEVVADEQKRAFRAVPGNATSFINVGLWRYSRHPNYFGEILSWSSLALFAAPGVIARALAPGGSWVWLLALASPAFVTLLLLRVSGVPLLEAAGKKRWGDDERYKRYIATTSMVVPWWPKRLA